MRFAIWETAAKPLWKCGNLMPLFTESSRVLRAAPSSGGAPVPPLGLRGRPEDVGADSVPVGKLYGPGYRKDGNTFGAGRSESGTKLPHFQSAFGAVRSIFGVRTG